MKLLFNYLPYSMKDSDSIVRSTKKANTKGPTNGSSSNTKITKFFSSFYSSSSDNNNNNTATANSNKDGTNRKRGPKTNGGIEKPIEKRGRKKKLEGNDIATQKSSKPMTNGVKQRKSISSSQVSSASSSSSTSSTAVTVNGKSSSTQATPIKKIAKNKKGNSKSSPKLRPRRRASQTYFFKYQLARNPLKAEEEDLKLALLASLQQNDGDLSKHHAQQLKQQQLINKHHLQDDPINNNIRTSNNNNSNSNISNNNNNTTNNSNVIIKQPKKGLQSNNNQQPNKHQKLKHPPPYQTVIQNVKPPTYDEEYLKRYRPGTEDFLTFICFRLNGATKYAPPLALKQEPDELSTIVSAANNKSIDQLTNSINLRPSNGCTSTTTGINVKISNDKTSNEYHNLRRSTSPCKSSASNHTASNSSPNHLNSPSNRRRPTRHSPRLASSSRKISEFGSLNHYTAYDNQITYEEEMKRASMALEDMAQEINGSDDSESGHQQYACKNTTDCMTTNPLSPGIKSLSPYKSSKHLVKGLMTREFAGAFADEEIIFESIKNHKL